MTYPLTDCHRCEWHDDCDAHHNGDSPDAGECETFTVRDRPDYLLPATLDTTTGEDTLIVTMPNGDRVRLEPYEAASGPQYQATLMREED